MSSINPTPGPWTVEHRHCDKTSLDDELCGLGLDVIGPPEALNRGQFARAADARLIAAAPELYEAIQAALRVVELWGPPKEIGHLGCDHSEEFECLTLMERQFRAAIAKAEGTQ